MNVITNNVPRDIIEAWELTPAERHEVDAWYIDWRAIDEGRASRRFFRYGGEFYDLAGFIRNDGVYALPELPPQWGGYCAETMFSAVVMRYVSNQQVVVGTACTGSWITE